MITPINGYILIEPEVHSAFMATQSETYQEIGVVVDFDDIFSTTYKPIKKGDKVFFDAWLAKKYPKNDTEFYWLIKYDNVTAVQHAE